jgi:hypothetical protein
VQLALTTLEEETKMNNWFVKGIWTGIIGGIVSGAYIGIFTMIQQEGFWTPFGEFAQLITPGGKSVALGVILHFVFCIIIGMIFGILMQYLFSPDLAIVKGLIYGAVVWAVVFWVVSPIAYGLQTFFDQFKEQHIVYLVVGICLALSPFKKTKAQQKPKPA